MSLLRLPLVSLISLSLLLSNLAFAAGNVGFEPEPELSTHRGKMPYNKSNNFIVERFMVVSANPLASKAGTDILRAGGNAMDAAVAVQMALGVVEPVASGIGGGAFLLYYNKKTNKLYSFDGRETAPAAASENWFIDKNGKAMDFDKANLGPKAVAVPGVLAMLSYAHGVHGKKDWQSLFTSAINLANNGFPITNRLFVHINELRNHRLGSMTDEEFADHYPMFVNGNKMIQTGEILKNPALARTMSELSYDKTASSFYHGKIANHIVATLKNLGGVISSEDLANYKAKESAPICVNYRKNKICTMGMPSSSLTILQSLKMLEKTDFHKQKPYSPEAIHYLFESMNLAFADRNQYMTDSDFMRYNIQKLLGNRYITERAKLISSKKPSGERKAGNPFAYDRNYVPALKTFQNKSEHPSTSHFVIVDKEGNVASMTTSIEHYFGSGLMVDGFILNNTMTDFSFLPEVDGVKVANRVQPHKRPRSSMSPIIIFDEKGNVVAAVGSPGGSRILNYVLKTIVGIIDWKMDLQEAINLPNFSSLNTSIVELEDDKDGLHSKLELMGYKVKISPLVSGLHGFTIKNGHITAGVDPRRDGKAEGE